MKKLLTTLIITAFIIPCAFAEDSEDTPLAKNMSEMNKAYKKMRRLKEPAEGPELARTAQQAMINAAAILPELVTAMPDGLAKEKAAANYRKMMGELITTLAEMEIAFLDEDMPKVKELVKAMRQSKKDGHDQFMEDE